MRAMLWFKQDLRLDDHPALQAGLKAECLLPVYVLDPQLLQLNDFGMRRMGVHRARFCWRAWQRWAANCASVARTCWC